MVQELTKLHDHVSVAGVGKVLVGMIALRHPARILQSPDSLTSAGFLPPVLKHLYFVKIW